MTGLHKCAFCGTTVTHTYKTHGELETYSLHDLDGERHRCPEPQDGWLAVPECRIEVRGVRSEEAGGGPGLPSSQDPGPTPPDSREVPGFGGSASFAVLQSILAIWGIVALGLAVWWAIAHG